MKDILKNPVLYYIAVPVLLCIWPVLVVAYYLPAARQHKDTQVEQYKTGIQIMDKILTLDPDRLKLVDPNSKEVAFTYDIAVNQIAGQCSISSNQYTVNSAMPMVTGGQKTQTANISLKQVDITKFARFISLIQIRWPNLECINLKLDKKDNLPDSWDIAIQFKYYY
jgi:hypothetical protein